MKSENDYLVERQGARLRRVLMHTSCRATQPLNQIIVLCPCSSVAEHSLGKGEVARSIRAMGTRNFKECVIVDI